MDALRTVMERLAERTGRDLTLGSTSKESMTEEELVRWKCEAYNSSDGNLHKSDGYNCSKCKNKGYIAIPKYSEDFKYWSEVQRECECQKVRRAIRRLERSGLKNIIKDYTFDKYETKSDWQAVLKKKAIEYTQSNNGAWFFIGGQSGAGKTHLCTAIAGSFLAKGQDVKYMLWRDDITKLKSCITDNEKYESLISEYKTANVLYIDDLFKNGKDQMGKVQRPTGSDVQVAFEILNYRYNNKELVTIISSERTIHELIEIDEALGGRISEKSVFNGFGFNIKNDMSKNYRLNGVVEL